MISGWQIMRFIDTCKNVWQRELEVSCMSRIFISFLGAFFVLLRHEIWGSLMCKIEILVQHLTSAPPLWRSKHYITGFSWKLQSRILRHKFATFQFLKTKIFGIQKIPICTCFYTSQLKFRNFHPLFTFDKTFNAVRFARSSRIWKLK